MATVPTPAQQVVTDAAKKYDVPPDLLWGVYGMETDFGSNVKTSSAGAIGPFQFIPDTAKAYGYPLTNNPTAAQFRTQANAAAAYLAVLHKGTGDWNAAVKRYSGGGYDADAALTKAGSSPDSNPDKGDSKIPIVGGAIDNLKDTTEFLSKFYALITDIMTWLRIGEGIAGVLLVYFGLKQLTGT